MNHQQQTQEAAVRHRAVFRECGLNYGQCYGSKRGYAANNPVRLYVANACVCTSDRECLWRGDLDLATPSDQQSLVRVSRRLRRKLFILREQSQEDFTSLTSEWLDENAIASVWRGKVTTAGYAHQRYGTIENVITRYAEQGRLSRPRRPRDEA